MAVKMAAKAPNTEDSMLAAMGRTVQEIVAAMARGMAAMTVKMEAKAPNTSEVLSQNGYGGCSI